MLPAFEQNRNGADKAKDGGCPGKGNGTGTNEGVHVWREITDEGDATARQSQLKSEVAEA